MLRQLDNPRELRGLKILSEPGSIIQVNKNEWDVRSQSIDAYYHVSRTFQKTAKSVCGHLEHGHAHALTMQPERDLQTYLRGSTVPKNCW